MDPGQVWRQRLLEQRQVGTTVCQWADFLSDGHGNPEASRARGRSSRTAAARLGIRFWKRKSSIRSSSSRATSHLTTFPALPARAQSRATVSAALVNIGLRGGHHLSASCPLSGLDAVFARRGRNGSQVRVDTADALRLQYSRKRKRRTQVRDGVLKRRERRPTNCCEWLVSTSARRA